MLGLAWLGLAYVPCLAYALRCVAFKSHIPLKATFFIYVMYIEYILIYTCFYYLKI